MAAQDRSNRANLCLKELSNLFPTVPCFYAPSFLSRSFFGKGIGNFILASQKGGGTAYLPYQFGKFNSTEANHIKILLSNLNV